MKKTSIQPETANSLLITYKKQIIKVKYRPKQLGLQCKIYRKLKDKENGRRVRTLNKTSIHLLEQNISALLSKVILNMHTGPVKKSSIA